MKIKDEKNNFRIVNMYKNIFILQEKGQVLPFQVEE